jgi:predicted outer membrane lipoprotein
MDGEATLSGLCLQKDSDAFFPGLPKRNRGLKLANAFSVILALQAEFWAGRYRGSDTVKHFLCKAKKH